MDRIIERLSLIFKEKELSPSKFADEIGVQRSSISHIMTGRNKPSLDLIMKVLDRYPEISAEWILSGKGEFKPDREYTLFNGGESEEKIKNEITDEETLKKTVSGDNISSSPALKQSGNKSIKKIVLFFNDSTYQEFKPGEFV